MIMLHKKLPQKLPISVFIIAKNEADRIATTIASVREWVDEVIVIDGGSTDETITVAKENGAKVEYNGNFRTVYDRLHREMVHFIRGIVEVPI